MKEIDKDTIQDLDNAKLNLKFWKDKELSLRNKVLNYYSPKEQEAKIKKQIADYEIELQYKLNRKIDEDVLDNIWDDLTEEEQECVQFKPSLILSKYKKLEEEGISLLLDAVTVKPAQGAVKINHI